jgi:hypothetical protein
MAAGLQIAGTPKRSEEWLGLPPKTNGHPNDLLRGFPVVSLSHECRVSVNTCGTDDRAGRDAGAQELPTAPPTTRVAPKGPAPMCEARAVTDLACTSTRWGAPLDRWARPFFWGLTGALFASP